jgi:hypothetical protein
MRIVGYLRGNNRSSAKVKHFGDALGAEYRLRQDPVDADLMFQWGFGISHALNHAFENHIPFIILENPVWGARGATYTWAYGGQNGLGIIPNTDGLPERPRPELAPWKEEETGQTTIFGQMPRDKALHGLDTNEWIKQCSAVLPESQIREHPGTLRSIGEELQPCLDRTNLAVTYSSTVGSETVIAGIPTIAMHPASLAWDVTTHNLSDEPIRPDREEWLHALSYRHIYRDGDVPTDFILGGYDAQRAICERLEDVPFREIVELGFYRSTQLRN